MKKSTRRFQQAISLWLLVAAAPLVIAQTPSPARTPPGSPQPVAGAPALPPGADPAPPPTTDQISYLIGLRFGSEMHGVGITNEVSMDAIVRGLKAGLQGTQITPAEQQQIDAFIHNVMQTAVARNETAAKEFLARNAKEKGVVTTASGLQYKIISAGDKNAQAIGLADKVTVDYRGKLIDGTEFDSSYSRGMPATFPVNGVIRGWQEALVLMKPGAKWQLYVPPELAYGDNPRPKIPGGSLLIFEVSVKSAEKSAPPAAGPAAPPGTPHQTNPPKK
jgi:FKBP-type peptidyl-prolyl cis-trans isomerase FklB